MPSTKRQRVIAGFQADFSQSLTQQLCITYQERLFIENQFLEADLLHLRSALDIERSGHQEFLSDIRTRLQVRDTHLVGFHPKPTDICNLNLGALLVGLNSPDTAV